MSPNFTHFDILFEVFPKNVHKNFGKKRFFELPKSAKMAIFQLFCKNFEFFSFARKCLKSGKVGELDYIDL